MSECIDTGLARMVAEKSAAELEGVLPRDLIAPFGAAPADVFVLKGAAGAEEIALGSALAGAEGEALRKALDALGWETAFFALCATSGGSLLEGEALAIAVEAVDPDLVLALDGAAARLLETALGCPALEFGRPVRVAGRSVCAVDDLAASLADPGRKKRVWGQLRAIRRERV